MPRKLILLLVAMLLPALAKPYGADGHETIGLLTEQLMAEKYPAAHAKAQALLGTMNSQQVSMKVAAIWADCLRAYEPDAHGTIKYSLGPNEHETPDCAIYHKKPGDEAFSLNYVKEHYSSCEYSHKLAGCHKSFHFADIPIQSNSYASATVGKHNHDIVHALTACMQILQGKAVAEPFTHIDQRAALLLLIHFMGDLHQPLHVGAVYLKPNGTLDSALQNATVVVPEETAGGNFIAVDGSNLHHLWDETDYRQHPADLAALKAEALKMLGQKAVLKTTAGLKASLFEMWADETLGNAREAYAGLRFTGAGFKKWNLFYLGGAQGKANYQSKVAAMHQQEVALASARLAWLLNALLQ